MEKQIVKVLGMLAIVAAVGVFVGCTPEEQQQARGLFELLNGLNGMGNSMGSGRITNPNGLFRSAVQVGAAVHKLEQAQTVKLPCPRCRSTLSVPRAGGTVKCSNCGRKFIVRRVRK